MNKTQKFIHKAKRVHNCIYDYSKVIYTSVDEKVEILCPIHGSFFQTPRIHLYKKGGCNSCAIDRSKATNTKTTKDFIKEAKQIHGEKYDYSNVTYINASTPVQITCPIHGSFFQNPTSHSVKGHGCKKCAVRGDTQWFLDKANKIHNNKYQYTDITYSTGKQKINISCKTHGIFSQRAESHLNGTGCPICGNEKINNQSAAEQEIATFIKNLGFDVQTGNRSILYPKEIDIFIPEKKLAIEYNGIFWHSELGGKDKYYHLNKTVECSKKNINLLHIFETEWLSMPQLVLSRISSKLGTTSRIHARKCIISSITNKEAKRFLDEYHIQRSCNASENFGLFFNNELVAVMTFGKSRFNKKIDWELLRYCSKTNTTIIGGASKLFKKAIITIKPTSIISYSDKRWNTGHLYSQLGFKHSHDSRPNYFYFTKNNTTTLLSRQTFQKHKLSKLLDNFNPNLSEWENMKNNKYNRIWDCGNSVWVWNN